MNQKIIGLLGVALLISLATVSVAKEKKNAANERDNAKHGLDMAKISLVDAIQPALRKVPGGKAVQADLKNENGQPGFEIEIVDTKGKHLELNVDAMNGMVGQAVEEKTTSETNADDESAEDTAAKAKVTLVRAIETAQKRVPGGKPFAACSQMENGNVVFSINFLVGNKIMNAQVDCQKGDVIEVKEGPTKETRPATITKVDAENGTVT